MISEVTYTFLMVYVIVANIYLMIFSRVGENVKSKLVVLWIEFISLILALGHCIFWCESSSRFAKLVCVVIMLICSIAHILRLNSKE